MHDNDELLSLIRDQVPHPATARDLTRILKVPREERVAFKRQLKALVAAGRLVQTRGNRFGLPDKMDLVVGRLSTTASGFGFVTPEEPLESRLLAGQRSGSQDIFIPAPYLAE